jgi:hypothetical protein
MTVEDLAIAMTGSGVWTTDAFYCEVTSGLGAFTVTQSAIATPATLWVDNGNGYEETALFGGSAQEVLSMCPTAPLFWESFAADDFGRPSGETATIGGREAVRADLADVIETMGSVGAIPGFEGSEVAEMVVWLDVETGTILSFFADVVFGEEMVAELGFPTDSQEPIGLTMSVELDNIYDPDLTVDLP